MYILKNAMKNIWRNKGRNMLMGLIILGIIISTVVAFSINTTTDGIIKDYKNRFGSEVTLVPDMEKLISERQAGGKVQEITNKQYFEFAKSDYIKESIFTSEIGVLSDKLKAIDEDVNNKDNGGMMTSVMGADGKQVTIDPPKMKILGNSTIESLEEFKNGKRKIVDGEMYKGKDDCIISEEFAKLNNIKVGDFIEVNAVTEEKGKPYKLKVTGIYFDSTKEYGGMPFKSAYMNKRNEILTNFETIQGISGKQEPYIQAKYYLKNPDMIEAFEKEVRAKGLPDIYTVSIDKESYNKIVSPVEELGSITVIFIGGVLGLGAVILILLNTLSIRERKYEIGVLRAMGMKKGKVALGLIAESLIITAICLGIGIGVGSGISQPISNSMLQKQIKVQAEAQNKGEQSFGVVLGNQSSLANEETISEIDVKLDGKALLEVTGVALLIILLSSGVSIRYITKYEPRKILTERS